MTSGTMPFGGPQGGGSVRHMVSVHRSSAPDDYSTAFGDDEMCRVSKRGRGNCGLDLAAGAPPAAGPRPQTGLLPALVHPAGHRRLLAGEYVQRPEEAPDLAGQMRYLGMG